MSYLIHGYEVPPDANTISKDLDFEDGKCFCTTHSSLKEELIQRASLDHPNTADDSAMLYKLLDNATKSSPYNSTLKAFVKNEDGVASYEALYKDYGGNSKWEKQYDTLVHTLGTRKWKST